jgi:hypothetical protein
VSSLRALRVPVVCALVFAILAVARIPPAAAAPLRGTDWNTVLTSDPRVRVPEKVEPPLFVTTGPFIVVDTGDGEVSGFAATADVLYGDLDGDGGEEAVIPINSGGTAGTTGYLLYAEVAGRPRLLSAVPGYRLGLALRDGALVVHAPYYAGFEPNCCPSATVVTAYALTEGTLSAFDEQVQPNVQAQEITVIAFYQALNEGRFADAYALLSPAFRSRNPFNLWRAGYATTERITVEQARGGLLPNVVAITVSAVDRTPAGAAITRRFGGAWHLVWSAETLHWLLDRADIFGSP